MICLTCQHCHLQIWKLNTPVELSAFLNLTRIPRFIFGMGTNAVCCPECGIDSMREVQVADDLVENMLRLLRSS
jgi:hypothetical protein